MNKLSGIKQRVKEKYGEIVQKGGGCCSSSSCCGNVDVQKIGQSIGYTNDEIHSVPEGANLGLGCGNPAALASLKRGETVLDLGSGAGFDAFLAARAVGDSGRVIGVDMTPQMVEKARFNAKKGKYANVEFKLGEIENLPIDDNSIDVIISNCVINLSTDKEAVFREAFRVLKKDGRLMVSDLVLTKELPEALKDSVEAYVGCVAGALLKDEYLDIIKKVGFQRVNIIEETSYPIEAANNAATSEIVDLDITSYVTSIKVEALK